MNKYYEDDKGIIYHDDCFNVLQTIPDKSIDLILCDLPYGTTSNKWDSILDLPKLWEQYNRVIKDGGAIVLFAAQPFTSTLVCSNLKDFKYSWVWKKSLKTNFLNAKRQPLRQHEDICIFYKSQPTYNPQGVVECEKVNRRGSTGGNYHTTTSNAYVQKATGYPSDVLEFPNEGKQLHPTQKPIALLEYLIRTYSNEGELVLDNTAGVLSVPLAAKRLNRKYIGIEKELKYVELGVERLK